MREIISMIIARNGKSKDTCNVCGETTHEPFLSWWGAGPGLNLCAGCCATMVKRGFVHDLLAMKAKHDIETSTGERPLVVLVRNFDEVMRELDCAEKKEFERIREKVDAEEAAESDRVSEDNA
jgi:hypothetical protein